DSADSPMQFESQSTPGNVSLPVISVSGQVAQNWLKGVGKDLSSVSAQLNQGKLVQGFSLGQAPLKLELQLNKLRKSGRNVLARLPVKGAERTVVVGAHLDHLGKGHSSSSLARDKAAEGIHYGADDN